jgi:hypothetical protein
MLCHYSNCHAECAILIISMLSVIMLSVIMLSVMVRYDKRDQLF